jgi:hypothetical protein
MFCACLVCGQECCKIENCRAAAQLIARSAHPLSSTRRTFHCKGPVETIGVSKPSLSWLFVRHRHFYVLVQERIVYAAVRYFLGTFRTVRPQYTHSSQPACPAVLCPRGHGPRMSRSLWLSGPRSYRDDPLTGDWFHLCVSLTCLHTPGAVFAPLLLTAPHQRTTPLSPHHLLVECRTRLFCHRTKRGTSCLSNGMGSTSLGSGFV